jgi:FKBP-type peptidyl-prolyl cis-trans isomerase
MKKQTIRFVKFVFAGLLCAGVAQAQTAPATGSGSQTTAPANKSAAGGTGTAKSGTATAKKPATATVNPLKTEKDKRSYAAGLNIGKKVESEMKAASVDVDPAVVARGIRDALTGAKPLMTDAEQQDALKALDADIRTKLKAQFDAISAANKKQGDDFLAANKAKEGVTTLPSGLQYKIITPGSGPKPSATDKVVCNYRGTLLDGTEFDNSYKRGQPLTIGVNNVIKGWTEALQMMPVGSKWQLAVPSDLAYGPQGRQGIPPNSTLVFEIELLSIAPKAEDVKPTGDSK